MKTLVVHYCNSIKRYPNYPIDHTIDIDHDGIIHVSRASRTEQYEMEEIAVYANWDYYTIKDDEE